MKDGFKFLKADFIIQSVFFMLYFFSVLSLLFQPGSFLFILILHFFTGIWQLVSCIIHISSGDGLVRKNYFISVIAYFVLLSLFAALSSNGYLPESDHLFMIGIGILPMSLAIWYFILTSQEYKKSKLHRVSISDKHNFENQVLDENIWE